MPLENLEKDPYLKKVRSFYPVERITVFGGYDYSIHIYKKSPNKGDSIEVAGHFAKNFTFEGVDDPRVIEADSVKAWRIDESQEYGPTLVVNAGEIGSLKSWKSPLTLITNPRRCWTKMRFIWSFPSMGMGRTSAMKASTWPHPRGMETAAAGFPDVGRHF